MKAIILACEVLLARIDPAGAVSAMEIDDNGRPVAVAWKRDGIGVHAVGRGATRTAALADLRRALRRLGR